MNITNIPYGLPSQIYRTAMPSKYCNIRNATADLKTHKIAVVIILCKEDECRLNFGGDLKKFYEDAGARVRFYPIPDFGVTNEKDINEIIDNIILESHQGNNILIHCRAGIGRTGMVLACLAKKVFNITGKEAVEWVRKYVIGAVETDVQHKLVKAFLPKNKEEENTKWPKEDDTFSRCNSRYNDSYANKESSLASTYPYSQSLPYDRSNPRDFRRDENLHLPPVRTSIVPTGPSTQAMAKNSSSPVTASAPSRIYSRESSTNEDKAKPSPLLEPKPSSLKDSDEFAKSSDFRSTAS